MRMNIPYKKVNPNGIPFTYATEGSVAADVYAMDNVVIPANTVGMVNTGIAVELPEDTELQIRARSGLASRGLMIANGIGTIDSDYRGEVRVLLYNSTTEPFNIRTGDRIAQVIPSKVIRATYMEVNTLSDTVRGGAGFGSTGR